VFCFCAGFGYECRLLSELEAVAEFAVDLAGVVEVEAAEGEAVVEQDAAVGGVGCGDGGGESFAEGFAEGEVEGGVLGQVGVGVARVCLIFGCCAGRDRQGGSRGPRRTGVRRRERR
jgi:hypothetical protein